MIINGDARTTPRRDENDMRDFPELTMRPVSHHRDMIMRNTFGDIEGRTPIDSSRTSRGSYREAATTSTSAADQRNIRGNDNLKEEEIDKIIQQLQAAEGEDSTVPLRLIETLVGELVRRILTATEKGSFFSRLFKTASLHSKHATK